MKSYRSVSCVLGETAFVGILGGCRGAPFELLGFTDPNTMCVDTAKDVYMTDFSEKRVTECPQGAITSTRILGDREGTLIHYLRLNRLLFKSEPRWWALRRKLTISGAFYAVQAARDDQVRS